jgi:hypothetical protein
MHKILVIRLYFILDALHVSNSISPSSGATLISCTSHIQVYANKSGCCVAIATQQPDVWYRHIPNHKNFIHLIGLYTYCKMMHGAYNVKNEELDLEEATACV